MTSTPGVRGMVALWVLLAIIVSSRILGQDSPVTPLDSDPIVMPVADRTSAVLGRTRVIAWRLAAPASGDLTIVPTCEPEGIIEFVRPFEVLAGRDVGYLRVRALAPGSATIRVASGAMVVHVRPDADIPSAFDTRPRIVSPVAGAALWGVVGVGVEVFDPPGRTRSTIRLRLSNGDQIDPISETPPEMGPHRRVVFQIDTGSLPEGNLLLTAVGADGVESEAMGVRVVRPTGVVAMEAEGEHAIARPARFGASPPTNRMDASASGGAFVSNASSYPAVCFPLRAERAGLYQVVLRVSGDMAGGSMPIVALHVGDEEYPRTSATLVSERWHRLAIGAPIRLEAGEHVVTALFANDFYEAGLADRNLRIDTIEAAMVEERALGELARLSIARTGDSFQDARLGAMEMMMMGGAMDAGAAMGADGTESRVVEMEDPDGTRLVPLRVAFDRVFEGRTIAGELEVRGIVHAEGAAESRDPRATPVVSLLVNGREVGRQRTLAPRFVVDAPEFSPGENKIQLVAMLDAGVRASTPEQQLTYDVTPAGRESRAMHRFSIRDERWDDFTRQRLAARNWPAERLTCALMSEGTARLALPHELQGEFDVSIVALGEEFEGAPIARVELEAGGHRVTIGEKSVGGWWQTLAIGGVMVPEGEKSLLVSFVNDRYEATRGDRNLLLESVILRERGSGEDGLAPSGVITHPKAGETIGLSDALVARVADDLGVAWVELLVDGRETGVRRAMAGRDGLVVLPVGTRGIGEGERTLSLRVVDGAGNASDVPGVCVLVSHSAIEGGTVHARAVHVLRRFGFGADDRQLARILEVGTREWLIEQLATDEDGPAERAALGAALVRFPDGRNSYEVPRRAVHHAMRTHAPARARLALVVDNLFSTWIRKVEGEREWAEHRRFAAMLDAPMGEILLGSASSPAMLAYLDQERSFAGRINENYAREIMELHTLGVEGGYAQADVRSLATLLTGWTAGVEGDPRAGGLARAYAFRFDPLLSDGAMVEVLGARFEACAPEGRFDRVLRAIETLAAHPSTAGHVAGRLCEHYVGVPAPVDVVDGVARAHHESGGDLLAMVLAIHDHPAFWDSMERGRLASALDYGLNLARLREDDDNPWRIADFLQRSGRQVFDRATPDGYPEEDGEQADTNAMIQRWGLAHDMRWLLASLVPDPIRYGDPTRIEGWEQVVVDLLAIGITGRTLTERSNEAALTFLREAEGSPAERVLAAAPFVAQLPEANLR